MDRLTAQEKEQMSKNGETSGSGIDPQRTLLRVDRVCNSVVTKASRRQIH